jgi:hydrogenase maturation protease
MILVAAVGNLWLGDDGFAGEVAKRLRERGVPDDVAVADFGTGGLDLAYEVMRGYDALVLVDVSRQQGEPGTLYVMEVDPDTIETGIEDGAMIDPHGMDPETVLRFVKATGGWPGKVVVVACEPESVEDVAIGLSPRVEASVERAVALVLETVEELRCTSYR